MFTKEDTNKIKGIAVLMLIFHHLYLVDYDISYLAERSFSFSVIDLPITAVCFRICVYIFCFLSAYGTSAGFKDRKCDLKYYVYRSWRLLSPYWFTLIVLNLVYMVVYRSFFYSNPLFLLFDMIPILDILGLPYSMFCPVLWYMNFTFIMIVALPLIYKLTEKIGGLAIVVTFLVFRFLPAGIVSPFGGPYIMYLFAVEFGVLFQTKDLFGKIKTIHGKLPLVSKVLDFIGLILYSFFCPYIAEVYVSNSNLGLKSFLITTGAISLIAFGYLYLTPRIAAKPLEVIGRYSYDMYLVHITVMYALDVVPLISDNNIILYITNVLGSFLAAYTLYLLKKYSGWFKLIDKVSKKIQLS